MTTNKDSAAIANTTLRQLGGQQFLAMTGARDIVFDERGGITMRLPKAANGIKWVRVTLTDADLYELQGIAKSGDPIPAAYLDDVGVEGLRAAFEAMTSLRVSL